MLKCQKRNKIKFTFNIELSLTTVTFTCNICVQIKSRKDERKRKFIEKKEEIFYWQKQTKRFKKRRRTSVSSYWALLWLSISKTSWKHFLCAFQQVGYLTTHFHFSSNWIKSEACLVRVKINVAPKTLLTRDSKNIVSDS